jgi:hypothetical protein
VDGWLVRAARRWLVTARRGNDPGKWSPGDQPYRLSGWLQAGAGPDLPRASCASVPAWAARAVVWCVLVVMASPWRSRDNPLHRVAAVKAGVARVTRLTAGYSAGFWGGKVLGGARAAPGGPPGCNFDHHGSFSVKRGGPGSRRAAVPHRQHQAITKPSPWLPQGPTARAAIPNPKAATVGPRGGAGRQTGAEALHRGFGGPGRSGEGAKRPTPWPERRGTGLPLAPGVGTAR